MPYQKIDGTIVTLTDVVTLQNVDYNLHNVNNQNKAAYGLSVQVVYSSAGGFDWTLKLQGSNDGVNFSDVVGSSLNITANGIQFMTLEILIIVFFVWWLRGYQEQLLLF